MKPLVFVGIDNYHIAISSGEVLSTIGTKIAPVSPRNPIGDRKMMLNLPFNELRIGYSIWINIDTAHPQSVHTARLAANRYSKQYNGMFYLHKHRGDARKVGYMWLEIGRVK